MQDEWDVVVVGGGPAGLSAALYLGRSRRHVLVVDEGSPRHAVSSAVHNFLTRDGTPPEELRRIAWEQMAAYPSVRSHRSRVERLSWSGSRWELGTADGLEFIARAVVLATGVVDEHPDIPGYWERWGHAIHHCPFCHGWEMQDRPLAVLIDPALSVHLPVMLSGWSNDVVALTHGRQCTEEQRAELAARSIDIVENRVVELRGPGRELEEIVLDDGTVLRRRGMFVAAPQRMPALVASQEIALTEEGYVAVDSMHRTNLPMLWAAGDVTSRMQQVVMAAAQGATTGASVQMSFVLG